MQKKVLPVLFVTLLLDMIGIGIVFPIIPIVFTDPTSPSFLLHGYSQSQQFFVAGLITAIFGFMQFIAAPILGEFSDVYGRKRLLTIGVAVLAFSQLMFGFGIATASIGILLVSRIFAGLAGANFSIAQAAIADVTEPRDRAKNFGLMGAAFGMGFILGPILGGLVASATNSASSPFWLAGALGLLNVLFISLFLPETRKNADVTHNFHFLKGIHNIRDAFADKQALPVYLANFLYWSGFAFFTSFIGILLVSRFHFSEGGIGTFFGVVGVWVVITQIFILRLLTKWYSEKTILFVSIPIVGISILLYPFMSNAMFLYILLPFLSVPQGLSMANLTALVSKSVSPDKQGAAMGINGSLSALSQGVIPLVAGLGSGALGLTAPFIAGGVLVASAWGVLFWYDHKR